MNLSFIKKNYNRKLNLTFMAIFVLAMLISYVFLINYSISQKYRFDILKRRFEQQQSLSVTNLAQTDEQTVHQLLSFAHRIGMVEAKDVYALFQDQGFALSRALR